MAPGFTEFLLLLTLGAILLLLCAVLTTGIRFKRADATEVEIAKAPKFFQWVFFVAAFFIMAVAMVEKFIELRPPAAVLDVQVGRVEFSYDGTTTNFPDAQFGYNSATRSYLVSKTLHFDHPFKEPPKFTLALVEMLPLEAQVRWDLRYDSLSASEVTINVTLWPSDSTHPTPPIGQFGVQWSATGEK